VKQSDWLRFKREHPELHPLFDLVDDAREAERAYRRGPVAKAARQRYKQRKRAERRRP